MTCKILLPATSRACKSKGCPDSAEEAARRTVLHGLQQAGSAIYFTHPAPSSSDQVAVAEQAVQAPTLPFLQVAEFTQVLQQLPTGALLAAAFITYLGKEAEDVRQAKLTQWCVDVKVAARWSLIKFLASETEQLTWKTQGTQLFAPLQP